MAKKKHVALIFGGRSAEHEVSLLSARNVAAALDQNQFTSSLIGISQEGSWYQFSSDSVFANNKSISDKNLPQDAEPVSLVSISGETFIYSLNSQKRYPVDVAFPVLHGTFGEDGCIQGLFKMVGIPFVGCGVFASSAGMDKEIMKRILKNDSIPYAKYLLLTPRQPLSFTEISKSLGTPFFIKPANMGSSVGVHKIKTADEFARSLKDAFLYDSKVLAEEFIEGRELECSVLGHNHAPEASVCGEVISNHEFYSYEAKYLDENGAVCKIPADVPNEIQKNIQEIAKKTFTAMGCEGLTRVDFFWKKSGEIIVNEINTLPGFTNISMYPKMWESSGIKYQDLITRLIQLAFENFESENSLNRKFADLK
jgi:D-alanine-D-alanine ligase